MRENDYVVATNLAKIRAAKNIVFDVLPIAKDEEKMRSEALVILSKLEKLYNRLVHGDPGDGDR